MCFSVQTSAVQSRIRSEVTSRKARLHLRSIQTERGLCRLHLVVFCEIRCSVCQYFKFASAADMKRVTSFRWSLFLFLLSFSFFNGCLLHCVKSFLGLKHVETEGTFLYRLFTWQTFWFVVAGKVPEQLINDGLIPFRYDRKSCKWASMHNSRVLVLLNGLQPLLILVTPLFDNSRCPLWEMFVLLIPFFKGGIGDDNGVEVADSSY